MAPRTARLGAEALEDRCVPATFVVTKTDDAGPGSFRLAIERANAFPGADTIRFVIGGGGPETIQPASPLPVVTDPVVIDATTQPGFSGAPLIVLDGTAAGPSAHGLLIAAGQSTVTGLVVSGFGGDGVVLASDANRVVGNYIGTDPSGTAARGNRTGVAVSGSGNVIGESAAGGGNLISGNRDAGVGIAGNGNRVLGNRIGTNAAGTAAVGNTIGVRVAGGSGNTIGGPGAARNLVSGNAFVGVLVFNGTSATVVQGNYIGTDVTGTRAVGNDTGVSAGGTGTLVGGQAAGTGNVISGNRSSGVLVAGSGVRVEGNMIGTDAAGATAIGNSLGVFVGSPAVNARVGGDAAGAGNLISGNETGVRVSAAGTTVQGNRIGTDMAGSRAVANTSGVFLESQNNLVGGAGPLAGNLISGNDVHGVLIVNAFNRVQGNRIGTDATGTASVPNRDGVVVQSTGEVTIGGVEFGAGNVISGNLENGVTLRQFSFNANNRVQGNFIGLDAAGESALGNGRYGVFVDSAATGTVTHIGGVEPGARNVISGNGLDGVLVLSGDGEVFIRGNFVGTDAAGTVAVGNDRGLAFGSGVVVGGTEPGAGNLISGNHREGVAALGRRNVIQGNRIGTDATGTAAVGNETGVELGSLNLLGGTAPGAGNLISGNLLAGVRVSVDTNTLEGNSIGTDLTGSAAVPNGTGVIVTGAGNRIGGPSAGAGNLISGNASAGVSIEGFGADGTVVAGNRIGTDAAGVVALGNETGIVVNAPNALIGGTGAGARNVISGNRADGVLVRFTETLVQGNYIGVDAAGTTALGNGGNGVSLRGGSRHTVGGATAGAGNVIAFNAGAGVLVDAGTRNVVRGNSIFSNGGLGIDLVNGGNSNTAAPVLSSAVSVGGTLSIRGTLSGRPNTTYTLEFFVSAEGDPSGAGEGERFVISVPVTTDADGNASFALDVAVEVPPGAFITATATDPFAGTSEFSNWVVVTG